MRKLGKLLLTLLCLLVLALVSICIWQKDNLLLLLQSRQYGKDQLQDQMTQNEQMVNTAIDSAGLPVRDLTEEEKQALQSGEVSREEILAAILYSDDTEMTMGAESAENTDTDDRHREYLKKLAEYIAEAYMLRAEFVGQLEEMFAEAKAEYRSIPKANRTVFKTAILVAKYVKKAGELEAAADAAMEELLSSISELCQEYGESDEIVATIRESYKAQKSSTKAYYLSLLEEKTK